MKVIDLLNKIANGEEVPNKIRITILDDRITRKYNFFYDEDDQEYKDDELFPLGARLILERVLNEKVEITEEKPKNNWNELKEYCLNEQIPEEYDEYNSYIEFSNNVYENVLNKMQELENKQCHTTSE